MKKHIRNFAFLVLLGFCVFGILFEARQNSTVQHIANIIASAQSFYHANPALAVFAFCCAHLICSMFSLPASCTVLNTVSGAVFGFWLGCTIVYPITLISATIVYFVGTKLRGSDLARAYAESLSLWERRLADQSFFSYVALRLVPILPFCLINVVMGIVRVPFALYILTTAVGVFFDVTVLNSLGAGAGALSDQKEMSLAISFFILLIAFFLLRILLAQAYDHETQGEEA